MRWTGWRRAIALVALIVGVGVAASDLPAAAVTPGNDSGTSYVSPTDVWWT